MQYHAAVLDVVSFNIYCGVSVSCADAESQIGCYCLSQEMTGLIEKDADFEMHRENSLLCYYLCDLTQSFQK